MHYKQRPISHSVFRAYDIRGLIDLELDEDAFYSLGLALGFKLNGLNRKAIFLARDARLSSEALSKALCQGLLDSNIDVIDLGTVPTPVMYYAVATQGIDSGLMVTGSHNPSNYNGIKIILASKTLVQADMTHLYQLVKAATRLNGSGHLSFLNIINSYKARVILDMQLKRPFTVVIDCGNGVAGNLIPEVMKTLGCKVIPLFCEVDGRFPNHHPDPAVEENLKALKQTVQEQKADLGLAFDGDADRLGLVTNTGRVIWPDRLLMFYAQRLLTTNPGAAVVFDVKCSNHLFRVIEKAGGRPIMCPTGHSIVKSVMKDEEAILAGEMSGHIFFKEGWYGFDDALYSACRLLEMLSQSQLTVEEQFQLIPDSVNTPEIKIPLSDDKKFVFMERFKEVASFEEAKIITIDGLRVEFQKGWGLLRASNTSPCLVARFEAQDRENLLQIQALFKNQLKKVDEHLSLPF